MSLLIEDAHAAQLAILYYSRNVRAQEQVERIFPDAARRLSEGHGRTIAR